jgi:hypothetical protein
VSRVPTKALVQNKFAKMRTFPIVSLWKILE